jgi:hypothetical protein
MTSTTIVSWLRTSPDVCFQQVRPLCGVVRRFSLLTHLPAARQPLRSEEERVTAPYRIDHIHRPHEPLLLLILVESYMEKNLSRFFGSSLFVTIQVG